jgi:hypothetical protein
MYAKQEKERMHLTSFCHRRPPVPQDPATSCDVLRCVPEHHFQSQMNLQTGLSREFGSGSYPGYRLN